MTASRFLDGFTLRDETVNKRITDAIETQDAAEAKRLMDGHVNAYAEFLGMS